MQEIEDVKRNLKNILASDEKKNKHFARVNKIFDIAKCRCYVVKVKEKFNYKPKDQFIYSNCICPGEKKIVNFDTYFQQVFERDAILLSEEDKKKYELIQSGKVHKF